MDIFFNLYCGGSFRLCVRKESAFAAVRQYPIAKRNADRRSKQAHGVCENVQYKDASDTLNLGVLYGTTVSGKFSYTNGQTLTLTNGKPDFSYNGLNFNSIWGKYYHYNGI